MTTRHAEVLVVEDDLPTREMYVYLLTEVGFSIRAAHNGRQAWDMCLAQLPQAVLTDLRVPGLNGFELARDLHSHFAERTPPIIAVTGYVPEDTDPRLEHAKFRRLLVKPVTPALLVEALEEAVRG